ncbi:hypothetical protein U9M48_029068 [Paspalum notatum var. saurae]|uniref:Uncharacterized protein n=1 Tax=Paspalum notatum var. saurae TaxID=547442 RepID=A0AAQ3U2A1_PASNO
MAAAAVMVARQGRELQRYDATYEGFVLPLRVTAELDRWPEMAARRREWVSAADAIARCPHLWMREALQRFADTVVQAQA